MISANTIGYCLFGFGIICGAIGTCIIHLDKTNAKPHLAPIRYIIFALSAGLAINAFIWGYCFIVADVPE